jgi:hypothetical protein
VTDRKRRLPLLDRHPEGDQPQARPAWQWVAFGAAAMFVAWLPLSAIAVKIVAGSAAAQGPTGHATRDAAIVAFTYGLVLVLGAAAGGFIVGRWGVPSAGVREAALAGLAAALGAVVLSWMSLGVEPALLWVTALAVPAAAIGGLLGRKAPPAG